MSPPHTCSCFVHTHFTGPRGPPPSPHTCSHFTGPRGPPQDAREQAGGFRVHGAVQRECQGPGHANEDAQAGDSGEDHTSVGGATAMLSHGTRGTNHNLGPSPHQPLIASVSLSDTTWAPPPINPSLRLSPYLTQIQDTVSSQGQMGLFSKQMGSLQVNKTTLSLHLCLADEHKD